MATTSLLLKPLFTGNGGNAIPSGFRCGMKQQEQQMRWVQLGGGSEDEDETAMYNPSRRGQLGTQDHMRDALDSSCLNDVGGGTIGKFKHVAATRGANGIEKGKDKQLPQENEKDIDKKAKKDSEAIGDHMRSLASATSVSFFLGAITTTNEYRFRIVFLFFRSCGFQKSLIEHMPTYMRATNSNLYN